MLYNGLSGSGTRFALYRNRIWKIWNINLQLIFHKEKKMKKGLIATGIAVMAMVMFSAYAFADGSQGWGRQHMGEGYHMSGSGNGPGYGDNGRGRYGKGRSNWGNLTEEDAGKLDKEREAFFKETEDVRQSVYQKRLEMRAEIAKKDPDAGKLTDLQKEISNLQADFALKRLNHRLEMRKLFPDLQAGAGMGHGRGYGRGQGSGGGCWR